MGEDNILVQVFSFERKIPYQNKKVFNQLTEENLRYWHHELGLSTEEIANLVGCTIYTIRYWLKKYNIPLIKKRYKKKIYCELNKENLWKWHIQQELSTGEIADIVGCTVTTVRYWIKKLGIPFIKRRRKRRRTHG